MPEGQGFTVTIMNAYRCPLGATDVMAESAEQADLLGREWFSLMHGEHARQTLLTAVVRNDCGERNASVGTDLAPNARAAAELGDRATYTPSDLEDLAAGPPHEHEPGEFHVHRYSGPHTHLDES